MVNQVNGNGHALSETLSPFDRQVLASIEAAQASMILMQRAWKTWTMRAQMAQKAGDADDLALARAKLGIEILDALKLMDTIT